MQTPINQFVEFAGHIINVNAICAIKLVIVEATQGTPGTEDVKGGPGTPGIHNVLISFMSSEEIKLSYKSSGDARVAYDEIGKLFNASMA